MLRAKVRNDKIPMVPRSGNDRGEPELPEADTYRSESTTAGQSERVTGRQSPVPMMIAQVSRPRQPVGTAQPLRTADETLILLPQRVTIYGTSRLAPGGR